MIETKFKKTDIGEIPEAWGITSIGDIFDFKNGLNKEKQFFGEGTPIINYMDVYHHRGLGKKNICGKVRLSKNEISRYQVKAGDVFFTRTSETPDEVGLTSVLKEEIPNCSFSGFVLRGRPRNNSLQVEYCQYCFSTKTIRTAIINSCTYTTRALTNGKVLSKIAIPIPPKSEQARIATTLSSVDNLISELEKLIEKKRAIKQGAMQQLLTGKRRLKGFSEPWVEKKLGQIGKTYNGLTGKTKDDFGVGSALYITFLNVLNNPTLKPNLFEHVNVKEGEKQSHAVKGDLFFNTSSETPEEVGICSMLDTDMENLYLNSFCFGYRLLDENVAPEYLAYYFRSSEGRKLMTLLAQGVTRFNLSKSAFNKASIKIPASRKEQMAIASVFSSMDREIEEIEAKRGKYIAIKQGMMQQLLTGKIRLI